MVQIDKISVIYIALVGGWKIEFLNGLHWIRMERNGTERNGSDWFGSDGAILASSIYVIAFYQLTSKTVSLSVRLLVEFVNPAQLPMMAAVGSRQSAALK